MKKIRVISDIHGNIRKYLEIIKGSEYSLQNGDFAFDFSFLDDIDSKCHKFQPGNHCNHDTAYDYPHCIGRYGEFNLNGVKGFAVSGGFSIDYVERMHDQMKTGFKSWWQQEELSPMEVEDCFQLYTRVKPELVISHESCTMISRRIGNPRILANYGFDHTFQSRTQELLQRMWGFYEPKLWINSHLHIDAENTIGRTRFISLGEFSYVDINSDLEVV